MFPFVSCIIFSGIIFYMIFTAILKVFREGKQLTSSVNTKRVVISFVSGIVGIGYAIGLSIYHVALCFGLMTLLFIVILRGISERKRDFFSIKNIICIIICGGIVRIHVTYQRMTSSNYDLFPIFIQTILKSDFITYLGLWLVTIVSYLMIRVMRRTGPSMKPIFTSIFIIKNSVTYVCWWLYWLEKQGYLAEYIPTRIISAEIIYISTFIIFIVQMIGLVFPRVTCIVDPEQEREHPLKRIKESLFFIIFNILHVFILIGGPYAGIQYVLMFVQIFTFFEIN